MNLPPILPAERPLGPSFDGYFRLTFATFTQLKFVRKLAWEDADLSRELCSECIPAHRAGYCEWETGGKNAISVGWAWFAIADGSMFISPGEVNSNLMLVDKMNYDLGAIKTSELLRAWLSSIRWIPEKVSGQFQ